MDTKKEAYIRQEQYMDAVYTLLFNNTPDFVDQEDYEKIVEIRAMVKTLRSKSSRKAGN